MENRVNGIIESSDDCDEVHFSVGGKNCFTARLAMYGGKPVLRISADTVVLDKRHFGPAILVKPNVSNVIEVSLEQRTY
jgi:hypothetical protein